MSAAPSGFENWNDTVARCGIRTLIGLNEKVRFACRRPRTLAAVARRDLAELAAADSRAPTPEPFASSDRIPLASSGVGRLRRIEDECAIVRVAVAVDVAGDERRVRRSRAEADPFQPSRTQSNAL